MSVASSEQDDQPVQVNGCSTPDTAPTQENSENVVGHQDIGESRPTQALDNRLSEERELDTPSSEESNLQSGYESAESNRFSGYESNDSMAREERLLEEMLRLKLTTTANSMLPPKQRIKLYQPKTKLEQFEDILIESQLLEQNLSSVPIDYEKFDLESLSLQDAISGITDFESSDLIFQYPGDEKASGGEELELRDVQQLQEQQQAATSCSCESCQERSALVAEMAEETKKLQQCWLQLRQDFHTVYTLVMEEAWSDSNRPKPDLTLMRERVQRLVWRDPHQLFQRLESIVRDCVTDIKRRLKELLQREAKNPQLAQNFISSLLGGHERLCEASRILGPVLSDLEINHLRRFSLTWELHNKHLYQVIVYTDPVIQNNLPIFVSQLRALYPNAECEERYTELVRGYLDFDVEMENVAVFWSGAEALLLEYSLEQQQLREKQKMLKSDWEKFKQQRQQIGNRDGEGDRSEGERSCECHVCTAPPHSEQQHSSSFLPPPPPSTTATISSSNTSSTSSALYPHLYKSSSCTAIALPLVTPPVAVAPCQPAPPPPNQALHLQQSAFSPPVTSALQQSACCPTTTAGTTTISALPAPTAPVTNTITEKIRPATLSLKPATVTQLPPIPQPLPQPKAAAAPPPAAKPVPARPCSHKHNSSNAKELKKLMGHDCGKKEALPPPPPRKSKSLSSVPNKEEDEDSTEEGSDDSSPEDSCSSSVSGQDKHCACCYCEVFGHGGPSVAPVSRNYPEMRERLRLLLSKKKKNHKQPQPGQITAGPQQQLQPPKVAAAPPGAVAAAPAPRQQPTAVAAPPAAQTVRSSIVAEPARLATPVAAAAAGNRASAVAASPATLTSPSSSRNSSTDIIAKKDVDEIIEYIEGNNNKLSSANEKKRQKKERQKQIRLEELRRRQEEERRRQEAEQAARRQREEEERRRREEEEKAAKKAKKKQAQKAKKLAAHGGGGDSDVSPATAGPSTAGPSVLDLEALRLKHIQEQKALLEKQKQQLEEQQRRLELQLQAKLPQTQAKPEPVPSSGLSKKQAKKAAKAAAASQQASAVVTPPSAAAIASQPYAAFPGYAVVPPPYQQSPAPYFQPPFMPGPGFPGAAFGMPSRFGAPPPVPGGAGMFGFSAASPPFAPPLRPAQPEQQQQQPKSDQPMVTIKRVMRPDSSEPTVTISVKKDNNDKEKEKVLFTLVNGQVLKTNHAPDNLIPSAKPLSRDLAKQILPEDMQDAALSKKQRKKNKKLAEKGEEGTLSPTFPLPAPGGFCAKPLSGVTSGQQQQQQLASTRVPLTPQGNVDLDKLSLPEGISISKITGPVPERKYFPSKPVPDQESRPTASWPQSAPSMGGLPLHMNQFGEGASPFGGGPMFPGTSAANPNVIVVDTNTLTTREEEEKARREEEKAKKNGKNKNKKKAESPAAPSPPTVAPLNGSATAKEWTPAQYGGYVPPTGGGGGGQVLIKSVNGKVVITPVPGTGNNPPLPTVVPNPPPAVTAIATVPKPTPSPPTVNGKPVVNGGGPTAAIHNNGIVGGDHNQAVNGEEPAQNGEEESRSKKNNKRKRRNADDKLEEINSIFAPRDGIDLNSDMDAADREIEQFKQFCFNSVPAQNRAKVSFDVKNIAFKKKN